MDAQSLRAAQAPIKAKYKEDPSAALVTLHLSSMLSSTSISCSLSSGPAISAAKTKVAGLQHLQHISWKLDTDLLFPSSPLAGGPDPSVSGELCSGDMLLEALVACAGVTLKAVATAMDIKLKEGSQVRAEGDLDFRGTLGVDRSAPVGFQSIRLVFVIESEEEDDGVGKKLEKLVQLTERYCVVLQTIKGGTTISCETKRKGGDNDDV